MTPNRRQILTMLTAGSLAGCHSRPDGLRLWAMGIEGEAVGAFVSNMIAKNLSPPCHVQAMPWASAHEKLLTAFAADNLPDIVALGNTWIPEFSALGALEPIDYDLNDSFSGAAQAVNIGGKTLAMPWYVDTRLLFYRKDLLEQAGFSRAPQTHNEWLEQLGALKKHQKSGQYGLFMPVDEYEPLVSFCLQAEAPILIKNASRGGFLQDSVRHVFEFVASLYTKGFAGILTAAQMPNLYSGFERGDFAFVVSGPWNVGEFEKRLSPAMKGKWATAPLPGPQKIGASLSGGVSLCLTRTSRHKAAALNLMKHLTSSSQQSAFSKVTGDLPASKSAWAGAGLDQNKFAKAFYDQLLIAKAPPAAPEWERIGGAMAQALERVVRGHISNDQALRGLNLLADKLLTKRRFMLEQQGEGRG